MPTDSVKSGYAPINGLKLYYEIHGLGEPLILLHGGVAGSIMFAQVLPQLAIGHQVFTVDLQAHGKTADIDRTIRFESMADDIAALIKYFGFKNADVLGYSLGGGVALRLTIQHPELVRNLLLMSTPCSHNGWYPEVLTSFAGMSALAPTIGEGMKRSPLSQVYPNADWTLLFTKLGDLLKRDYNWSSDIAKINTPTLLIYADADAVTPSHIMEFYGLLGGGHKDAGLDGSGRSPNQLAILPGFTHYTLLSSPVLPASILQFIEAPLLAKRFDHVEVSTNN
jgi:pimeloyl-ACP methyl ester carboxylesterase